jgi:hypothetical protein
MTALLDNPLVLIVAFFWVPFWFGFHMIAPGHWPYLSERTAKIIGQTIACTSIAGAIVLPALVPGG